MTRRCEVPGCEQSSSYQGLGWCFYHFAVAEGRLQETSEYLTEVEARFILYGRAHRDGRRLDAWALDDDDPIAWRPAA